MKFDVHLLQTGVILSQEILR